MMKHFLFLFLSISLFLCIAASGAVACIQNTNVPQEDTLAVDTVAVDSSMHISLLVAGDLMQHDAQIRAALQPDGSYDYSSYFEWVSPEIEKADVAIANLEVTLGGKPFKGYPMFSAPDEYLAAIRQAGFDLLMTSNNHSCDRGLKGILRTIQMCDSLGIPHFGTYADTLARKESYPYLLEKNGFRIAILGFTYGTNGIKVPLPAHVNLIDTAQIAIDIEKAKRLNPDVIIAFPHWGIEYENLPRQHMVKLAKWLTDKGVDHVIGGHPHVIQPVELREDTVCGKQHLVAYSLGNFVSDQASLPRYGGMMLRFELTKDGPSQPARITDCGYLLTFVSRPAWSRNKNYRIYPVNISDSLINSVEKKMRDDYVKLARDLFSKHNIGISEYFME